MERNKRANQGGMATSEKSAEATEKHLAPKRVDNNGINGLFRKRRLSGLL